MIVDRHVYRPINYIRESFVLIKASSSPLIFIEMRLNADAVITRVDS